MAQEAKDLFKKKPVWSLAVTTATERIGEEQAYSLVARYVELSQLIKAKQQGGKHPTQEYTVRAEVSRSLQKANVGKDLLKMLALEARALM